jgi:hypothetical protein
LKITGHQRDQATSTLNRRFLNVGRAIGVAVALLAVILFIASIPMYYEEFRTLSIYGPTSRDIALANLAGLGLSSGFYAGFYATLVIIFAAVCCVLAGTIFWRRPNHPMALFVVLVLTLFGTTYPGAIVMLETVHPVLERLSIALEALSIWSMFLFFYLFPDGRFVPSWTRWLAALWTASWVLVSVSPPNVFLNPDNWPLLLYPLFLLGWLLIGVFAQVYRYLWVSGPIERQQTKFIIFGFAVGLLGMLIVTSLDEILGMGKLEPGSLADFVASVALYCFVLLIPLSIGTAILRYRLYDIDFIINRTLVYSTLTATLGLIYYLGVGLFQALLRSLFGLTGQESSFAVVASTLGVAALFMPLRRRIQTFIDRRFYRTKYDARKTLEAFSTRVRDEPDLQKLSKALVEVVDETMKPSHVSLWLRSPPRNHKP